MEACISKKESFNLKIIIITLSILGALFIRFFLIKFQTIDYLYFLSKWYDFISNNGFFRSFKYKFSNYTPLYLHLIAICTNIPISRLLSIKLISIVFDFITALFVFKIVKNKYNNFFYSITAFVIILFLPTVILNGALWGQCDIIYSCMVIIAVYYVMKKKYNLAFIFYGISFALKVQSIFILPMFIFLWIKGKFKIFQFLFIPLIYFISIIPSAIAGRPLLDLLTIYFTQGQRYNKLTLKAPNIYQFFHVSEQYYHIIELIGIFLSLCIVLLILFKLYKKFKNTEISANLIVSISLLFSLVIPYFLPRMHERYFFMADILSVVYAYYFPRYSFVSIVIVLSSFLSYFPYLFGIGYFFLVISAINLFFIICFIFYRLYRIEFNDNLRNKLVL